MEWDAPAIVLDARPYGEGDAIATVMTADHGAHRGLARGGGARNRTAIWQPGNLVQVRWVARLAEQLGSFSAELVHPAAALAMDDALHLAMLSAVCAVAEGALPEREPHVRVFDGLVHLIAHLSRGAEMLPELIRWETVLLAELGYGLDLTSCAVTGETAGLAFVSPKTGRAVTAAAARDGQSADGAFGDIAPMVGVRPEGAPGWGDAGVLIPWQLWLEYGDTRTLRRSWDSMTAWLAHIERHNPDLLWRRRAGMNYGDWLHLGEDTPRDLVATAYFARSARVVADTARVIGHDPGYYDDLASRVAAAFADEFTGPDGAVGNGTQTGYVLALSLGIMTGDKAERAFARLASSVTRHGPLTVFLGLPLLCPVLASHGRADLAYAVLQRTEYPSLGYQIAQGATTIWERWDGWTSERGFQAAEMNSFNHYALGAVGDWLYGGVAGIGQRGAAYRDIVIAPVPGGGLTWARARQTTVRGVISTGWRIDGGRLVTEVDLPPGPDCEVILPGGARHVVAPGRHTLSAAWPAQHPRMQHPRIRKVSRDNGV